VQLQSLEYSIHAQMTNLAEQFCTRRANYSDKWSKERGRATALRCLTRAVAALRNLGNRISHLNQTNFCRDKIYLNFRVRAKCQSEPANYDNAIGPHLMAYFGTLL
jgi:hypothetical protein